MKHILIVIAFLMSFGLHANITTWTPHPEPLTVATALVKWQKFQQPTGQQFARIYNQNNYGVMCELSTVYGVYYVELRPNHYSDWYPVGTNSNFWEYICYS